MTFSGKSLTKADLARRARIHAGVFDWEKVDSSAGPDACWPWTGCLNSWGYGAVQWMGKATNASRAAYESIHGPVGDLVVCHRCDNPSCCNPAHLWADTQSNNLADCRAKGRSAGTFAAGAKHPRHQAKLTPDMVREARELYANGISQSEIGRRWGIHSSVISRAVRGERWGHVS